MKVNVPVVQPSGKQVENNVQVQKQVLTSAVKEVVKSSVNEVGTSSVREVGK